MLKPRIIALVGALPQESTLYADQQPVPADRSELVIHRRAHALLDPAFPWHYAQAFAQLDLPLPGAVHEPFIRTAYDHLMNHNIDDDINEAQVIQHPKWKTKRGFLEALLLLPDLRLDQVAGYTGLSVFTVQLYEQLFWNVRDRLNDQLFMNHLAYPDTKHVEFQPHYWVEEDPCHLMLRAAFNKDLDAVLQIFGSRTPRAQADVSAKRLKERVLADADHVVRAGGYNESLPVLESARRIILAAERHSAPKQSLGDDVIGLTAIGLTPGQSIMETVTRMMVNDTPCPDEMSLQAVLDRVKN